MITKIFQILIISFLIVPFAYSEGTIKSCRESWVDNGINYLVFPDDGGKPYGVFVELLLTFTNELELKLEFEEDSNKNCFKKLRSGEIDVMLWLHEKDDRNQWLDFIPINAQTQRFNFGISKNSKYSSKVDDFNKVSFKYGPGGWTTDKGESKFVKGLNHFVCVIFPGCNPNSRERRNYQNSFDHTWYGYEKEEIEIAYNCKKEGVEEEKEDDDDLDLTELGEDKKEAEVCDKLKLSEITTYIDKEFIFSLYMNQMSEIVKSKIVFEKPDGGNGGFSSYYHVYGPIFFNIKSPIDSVLLTGDDHQFLDYMTNIGGNMKKYWKYSNKLEHNIDYCLHDVSNCVYFDESVVTYLVMKNSYDVDFAKNDNVCNKGLSEIVIYSKDKEQTQPFKILPYQRISFQNSCFDRHPVHYFIGRQDSGFKTSPFLQNTYKYLIQDLALYHYLKVWNLQKDAYKQIPDHKDVLNSIKKNIKASKKIFTNDKEWKSVTSFLNQYGKLMKNSMKTRKVVVNEIINKAKQKKDKHITDLKNRVIAPKNIGESLTYFDIEWGEYMVFSTPYEPDGKFYGIAGTVKGMIGDYYKMESTGILGKRIFLLNTPEKLKQEEVVSIVGKFNKVIMLSTLFSAVKKPYAVFSDLCFYNGKLLEPCDIK